MANILTRPIRLPFRITYSWLLAPLSVYAIASLVLVIVTLACTPLARFLADDWRYASDAAHQGIIGGAHNNYMTWGGRFTSNLLQGAIGIAGTWTAPFAAFAFTSSFFIATWRLFHLLLKTVAAPRYAAIVVTTLFLATLLYCLADIGANFYWFTGACTYTLPLMICMFSLGAILAKADQLETAPATPLWAFRANLFLASFFSAGCSEVEAVTQIAVCVTAILLCLLFTSGSRRRFLCSSLAIYIAGSAIGLILLAIAPGNAVRQAVNGPHKTIPYALERSWDSSRRFYQTWVLEQWQLLLALCAVIGFGCRPTRPLRPLVAISTIIVLGIVVRVIMIASIFPQAYVSGIGLPTRAHIALFMVLLPWAAVSGLFIGMLIRPAFDRQNPSRQSWIMGIATALLIYFGASVPLAYISTSNNTLSASRRYANVWAQRERLPLNHPHRRDILGAWGVHDYPENLVERDKYGIR